MDLEYIKNEDIYSISGYLFRRENIENFIIKYNINGKDILEKEIYESDFLYKHYDFCMLKRTFNRKKQNCCIGFVEHSKDITGENFNLVYITESTSFGLYFFDLKALSYQNNLINPTLTKRCLINHYINQTIKKGSKLYFIYKFINYHTAKKIKNELIEKHNPKVNLCLKKIMKKNSDYENHSLIKNLIN